MIKNRGGIRLSEKSVQLRQEAACVSLSSGLLVAGAAACFFLTKTGPFGIKGHRSINRKYKRGQGPLFVCVCQETNFTGQGHRAYFLRPAFF